MARVFVTTIIITRFIMLNYLKALRLRALHTSIRKIELSLQSSHRTIKEFFERTDANGLTWPVADETTNASIRVLLFPERGVTAPELRAQPDFEKLHSDLARKGTNLTLLWEEYCVAAWQADLIPYSYTQYCDNYRKWALRKKATMRIKYKPGDAMQVDWAGTTIPISDPYTGEISNGYLFIAVLPCSCYTYAEVCSYMKSGNWLFVPRTCLQIFWGFDEAAYTR